MDVVAYAGVGFWEKLRRRKVLQWGIAYVAGAWGLLQGLLYVGTLFSWPGHVQRLAFVALALALPIVLVVAWYHGDLGEQHVTVGELSAVTGLFVLGGAIFWWYGQRLELAVAEIVPPRATVSPSIADPRPSIAVLPFENRSRLDDDAFFVDGIHDDILTQLSKVSALKVISRTSVERFRKSELSVGEIARQLGVKSILEGGVQRAGGRVRINVQLIDAATDAHVWAESYDRELSAANIFAIQSDVAGAIADALRAALTPDEHSRVAAVPTLSLAAWEAYQLGKQRMARRSAAALAEAEKHFRDAIAHDASFALAWVGLADTLSLQVYYAGQPSDTRLDTAEKALTKALEIDSNLAEAWASKGLIAHRRLHLERAELLLRRAISLNPNYAPAHHWLSMVLIELGRRSEALPLAERAVALDPLSAIIKNWLGLAQDGVGRFDQALVTFEQVIQIDPTFSFPYVNIGILLHQGRGRLDQAVPWYQKAEELYSDDPEISALQAQAYWGLGDDAEATRCLERSVAKGDGTGYSNMVASLLYLDRGDAARARKHATRAAELDPYNLFLVRDLDLRDGNYSAARARYAQVFPKLFTKRPSKLSDREAFAAIDLAVVLQRTGERDHARTLLDLSEAYFHTIPRLGSSGYRLSDVAIYALRGDRTKALAKLREGADAGCCRGKWRYYRDIDPNLASIRNEPEFKAVFADIERDMARQRAELAARSKNASLDVSVQRDSTGT